MRLWKGLPCKSLAVPAVVLAAVPVAVLAAVSVAVPAAVHAETSDSRAGRTGGCGFILLTRQLAWTPGLPRVQLPTLPRLGGGLAESPNDWEWHE